MRTIIAGPRFVANPEFVDWLMVDCPFRSLISLVISGHAKGFDRLGEGWAIRNNVPFVTEPVMQDEWNEFGAKAGAFRNQRMLWKYQAEALCCVYVELEDEWEWFKSRGTNDMRLKARESGLIVWEKRLEASAEVKAAKAAKLIEDDDVPF